MSKLTVFKGAFLIVPIEHDDATAESLSIAISELPALVEAAKPIVDRLNWHEDNLDYWTKASEESIGDLEFPVTAEEARALRSVLNRIKGGA